MPNTPHPIDRAWYEDHNGLITAVNVHVLTVRAVARAVRPGSGVAVATTTATLGELPDYPTWEANVLDALTARKQQAS